MTDATATAEKLKAFGHVEGKPVLASWMGGDEVAAGEAILNRADIPTFAYPDTAAMVFTAMYQYSENLRALYETPVASADPADLESGRAKAAALIQSVQQDWPHDPDRGRIQGSARLLRHPDGDHEDRQDRSAGGQARRRDRIPVGAEALFRNHHPQDRRRRRAVEPQGRSRRAQGLQRHQDRASRRRRARSIFRASPCRR